MAPRLGVGPSGAVSCILYQVPWGLSYQDSSRLLNAQRMKCGEKLKIGGGWMLMEIV